MQLRLERANTPNPDTVPMSCIHPSVLTRADELAREFASAQPFRHVQIADFLDASLCQGLLEQFPGFEARHALNEMGEVGGKAVRMDVRDIGPAYAELDRCIQSQAFLDLISRITGIPDLLHDPDYIGGGTHENRDGQGLDQHVDFNYHPRTKWHRRLNLIVYLNPHWEAEWGGELELHADPWSGNSKAAVKVPPLFNRCAIFETTENSWHGFSTIALPEGCRHLSRKSFAIYLYTRERPPESTAPPHATIYVPDSMPSRIQAGQVLEADDVRELSQRFARMRTQLRYLYEREKRFGAQIEGLEQALAEARAAQTLPLQGYATQAKGGKGLWPDDWAGPELLATILPTRKVRSLSLVLWSPPQLGKEQVLAIRVNDKRYTQVLRPGMRTPVELDIRAAADSRIELEIRAERSWVPASAGESGDERELAYRILAATLRHD